MTRYDSVSVLEALAFGDFEKDVLEAAKEISNARILQMELRRENSFLKTRIEEEVERVRTAS